MGKALKENGLSIVLLLLFGVFMVGQTLTGMHEYNADQLDHGEAAVTLGEYLTSGHFIEATAENWESEFLQMAAYVLLTIRLFQRGSAESKDPDKPDPSDRNPRHWPPGSRAPGPVRRGGLALAFYQHSLSIAFVALFLASFALHGYGGLAEFNEQRLAHGNPAVSLAGYMQSATFWFESFQNWQSEFLALASMVLLSIVLRQRGSPESKPVDAPHRETGAH
jgi:hypothetical protein